jgi:hypothetical protein
VHCCITGVGPCLKGVTMPSVFGRVGARCSVLGAHTRGKRASHRSRAAAEQGCDQVSRVCLVGRWRERAARLCLVQVVEVVALPGRLFAIVTNPPQGLEKAGSPGTAAVLRQAAHDGPLHHVDDPSRERMSRSLEGRVAGSVLHG